jgi:hypothetical protein
MLIGKKAGEPNVYQPNAHFQKCSSAKTSAGETVFDGKTSRRFIKISPTRFASVFRRLEQHLAGISRILTTNRKFKRCLPFK